MKNEQYSDLEESLGRLRNLISESSQYVYPHDREKFLDSLDECEDLLYEDDNFRILDQRLLKIEYEIFQCIKRSLDDEVYALENKFSETYCTRKFLDEVDDLKNFFQNLNRFDSNGELIDLFERINELKAEAEEVVGETLHETVIRMLKSEKYSFVLEDAIEEEHIDATKLLTEDFDVVEENEYELVIGYALKNKCSFQDFPSILLKHIFQCFEEYESRLSQPDLIELFAVCLERFFNFSNCSNSDKTELYSELNNNRSMIEKLKYVFENALENTFDNFDELLTYLRKSEKRNLLNI